MWGALLAFLTCAAGTLMGFAIRQDLPPHDETELVRQIYLWQGFAMMGVIDAATIPLIRWHGIRRLTNPLTIVLALAILAHSLGAFLYAARHYEALVVYDGLVTLLTLAQVAVFGWWLGSRNGRRDRRACRRTPSVNFVGRAVALRDQSHKAHPR